MRRHPPERVFRPGVARAWAVAFLVVAVVATLLAACSPQTVRTGSIVWHRCAPVQCATLSVPLDRAHPNGRHITLALARRPADGNSLGVLLTNPGGPGASGIEIAQDAGDVFDPAVLDHFDIVSWDPRGIGASAPVRCTDRLDFFYAVDRSGVDAATTRANVAVSKRLVDDCEQTSRAELPFVSTSATVDDMDAIRAAMGEPTVDYLGFSYGTEIGALYADRYPHRVRAMVLDGVVDPAQSYDAGSLDQAAGFEHALDAFLSWCRDNRRCAFARTGDPKTAFADLVTSLSHESLPGKVHGEQRTLGRGLADMGIAEALYGGRQGPDGWPTLADALNDAATGDGAGLLALADEYTDRSTGGTYDNETSAFYAIGCLDEPAPPTVAAVQQLAARAARLAPYFGASTVWLGLPCTLWPAPAVGRVGPVHARGAPPILVVGTTDDPATPYSSAVAVSHELEKARLLTYAGEGHTAYGRGSSCVDKYVDRYLVSLTLPPAGSRCR